MQSNTLFRIVVRLVALLAIALPAHACFTYEPPPRATLPEATDGILPEPSAPLLLLFSEPIVLSTMNVKIARYVTDAEGNLPDEDADPTTELDILFAHDPNEDPGNQDRLGTSALIAGATKLQITPSATLPIGPRLVLLVEAGLSGTNGQATRVRQRIVFGYQIKLDCNQPVARFKSGEFFSLVDVSNPIKVQIRLFASFSVDEATGRFIAQFTRAMRNPDLGRCVGLSCKSTEVCRLVPFAECVIPSESVGTVDEWSDLVPDATSDAGFSFTVEGCVVDQADGSTSMAASPVDVQVKSPQVTLRSTRLAAAFTLDAAGVLRGTGSLNAEQVQLGDIASGGGQGDMTFRSIPLGAIPGIPVPPKPTSTATSTTP